MTSPFVLKSWRRSVLVLSTTLLLLTLVASLARTTLANSAEEVAQFVRDFSAEAIAVLSDPDVTLVPTGPLTNIGTAFDKAPEILSHIDEIVLMGGAMREGGNRTPSAEFNMLADPHAADIVFCCGRPITAMGLDVTHKVLSTRQRVAKIKALNNPVATATSGMLSFFHRYDTKKYGSEGAPLHDPCTVAYLLQADIFDGKLCNVAVETQSELTLGHTAVDFWRVTDRPHNTNWIYDVDPDAFYELLTRMLARFGD